MRDDTHDVTAAIARGDEAAFARFYEAWYDRCLAYARTAAGQRDDAPDVVHDVMLTAARRMPPLADEHALAAWLRRTTVTHAIDRLRRDRRRAQRERHAARAEDDLVSSPDHDAERRERLDWIRAALADLPAEDRALIVARFAGDRTFAELGGDFAMTGNAVAGRLRRALAALRDKAEAWFDD